MRISNWFVVSCVCYSLLGCSSINAVHPTNNATQNATQNTTDVRAPLPQCPKKKNPMEVSFYSPGKMPNIPYAVIGLARVSKYNRVGVKRQDAIIHDAMRTVAASMGGDAIIDVMGTNKSMVGKVIAYQPKVVA